MRTAPLQSFIQNVSYLMLKSDAQEIELKLGKIRPLLQQIFHNDHCQKKLD